MSNEVLVTVKSKDESGPGYESAKRRATGFGSVMTRIGGIGVRVGASFGIAGAAAGALGVGLFKLAGNVVDNAVNLENMDRKSHQVFGNSFPQMEKWAAKVGDRMGLTKRETEGLAAGFADMLIPMGFSRDTAAQMSQKFGNLSGVLANWSNGQLDAQGASEALSGALTGEYDTLQRLGIPITQAKVDAEVLAMKKRGVKLATEEQYKAEAALNIIMKGSTDAQKAYANSAESLGAQVNEAKTKLKNLRQELIVKVTPWLTTAFTWFNTHWMDIEGALLDIADSLIDLIGPMSAVAYAGLKVAAGLALVAFWRSLAAGNKKDAVQYQLAADKLNNMADQAQRVGQTIEDKLRPQVQKLRDNLNAVKSKKVDVTLRDNATRGAKAVQAHLNAIHSKTVTVQVIASGVQTVQRVIDSITGHAVAIQVGFVRTGRRAEEHGGIVGAATGGIRSNAVMVGEHGRELVDLPPGSRVHSNPDTERLMSGTGGGQPLSINLILDGKKIAEVMLDPFRNIVRTKGGNVQAVLGS